jgi:hypothetical protein
VIGSIGFSILSFLEPVADELLNLLIFKSGHGNIFEPFEAAKVIGRYPAGGDVAIVAVSIDQVFDFSDCMVKGGARHFVWLFRVQGDKPS